MDNQKLSRRDLLLAGSGVAMLCLGKLADSAVNGIGQSDHEAMSSAVERLRNIPAEFSGWTSLDEELSERELEVAEIQGYVRRGYRHRSLGYDVHLTVLCGHAGPMSVHPPTACFEGVGYTLSSGPTITTVPLDNSDLTCEFNKSSFKQSDTSVPEVVRVFWGWSADGPWTAPGNPRLAFRGQSYLYKIYATDRGLETPGKTALPQIERFMQDALPMLAEVLAP